MESDFPKWSNKAIIDAIPTIGEEDKARALYELKIREGQGMHEGLHLQEVLPGMTERDILEGYTPEQLKDYKEHLLDKYNAVEQEIHLVNDVLDGYGYEEDIT